MRRSTALAVAFVTLLSACATIAPAGSDARPEPQPDPVIEDVTPTAARLEPWRGKVVLVNFWASWCGPCIKELPGLDALHRRADAFGGTVVAFNVDEERSDALATARRLGLRLPMLWDGERRAAALYKPNQLPFSLLVDRSGKVRRVIPGELDAKAMAGVERAMRELAAEPSAG